GTIEQRAAAVLHHVLEDCPMTRAEFEQHFPPEVCRLVDGLTHVSREDYEAFVGRVAQTPGALLIKKADIRDNYGRLHLIADQETRERLQTKYGDALALIQTMQDPATNP